MIKAGIVGFLPEDGTSVWQRFELCAKIGYRGMDMDLTYAVPEGDLEENYKRITAIGLKPLMSGVPCGLEEALRTMKDKIKALRIQRIDRVCMYSSSMIASFHRGYGRNGTYEEMMRDFETMNRLIPLYANEGIQFCYHNHFQEFTTFHRGVSAFDHMLLNVDHRLMFNLDVGWVMVAGLSPSDVLRRLEGRIGGVHMKDFHSLELPRHMFDENPASKQGFTSLGTGKLDVDSVLGEMERQGIEYACVEQDALRNLNAVQALTVAYLRMKESGRVE